ncbi:MAG: hypothetical protein WCY15_07565 [Phenylobacterium sp.]|jgi:hypothetical protein|uniref:hypothetical protein n=1 Tax=Phenylobacterium sp. TaxID=1871053 RepID=UPI002A366CD6|nr:hypothetical protein [Phenylobacterium sp.]MDX9997414.1 hypothetical protein [Phenylobacterium sp.]
MTPAPNRKSAWPLAVLGAALALGGGAVLIGLFVVLYADNEVLSRQALRIGLAGTTLISAIAQIALFAGLWLIWRASRRRTP